MKKNILFLLILGSFFLISKTSVRAELCNNSCPSGYTHYGDCGSSYTGQTGCSAISQPRTTCWTYTCCVCYLTCPCDNSNHCAGENYLSDYSGSCTSRQLCTGTKDCSAPPPPPPPPPPTPTSAPCSSCTVTSYGSDANCSLFKNNAPVFGGLTIRNNLNNNVVTDGTGKNQICQPEFNGSRTVSFVVSGSDSDGDSLTYTVTWNGHSVPMIGNVGTITIPDSWNNVNTYPINVVISDGYTTVSDSSRQFKIWDCKVQVSGKAYDGSDTSANCSPASFTTPVPNILAYCLVMNDVGPGVGIDRSMTVNSPDYISDMDPLTWGRDYIFTVSGFAGTSPTQLRINNSGSCSSIQFNTNITDPYAAIQSFTADFASILDQDPWWQTDNGGAVSNNTINNRVPVTCKEETCKISRSALTSSINVNNEGRPLEACQSVFYSGNSAKLVNVNTNYSYFYDNYFVKNSAGISLNDNKTIADIGATGVYFVDGNLDINANKIIAPGTFLMIIVKGDITVSPVVNRVDGILVANNIIANSMSNNQLVFNGSLFAFNNIDFSRGFLIKSTNNLTPAIVVRYNPQLLFNIPASISKALTNWQWGN